MEGKESRQGNAVPDPEKKLNILLVFVIVIYELFFFRALLAADTYPGLTEDSLLVNLILEHWHDVFAGNDPWNTLPSFWPAEGSIGFSDAMLIPGMLYCVFRIVIAEPVKAFIPTLITMHLLGCFFSCMFLRKLGCSRKICLIGLLLSLWSSSFMQIAYHTQFYSIAWLPVVCYLALLFWERRKLAFKKRLPYGIAFTIVYGGLWLTAFYTAYFFSLFAAGFVVFSFLFYRMTQKKQEHKMSEKKIVSVLAEAFFYAVFQIVWVIPFLLIYLPAYSQKKDYDAGFVSTHAPDLWDIFRTGSVAPLGKWLTGILPISVAPDYEVFLENRRAELSCGWGWLTVLLFAVTLAFCFTNMRREEKQREVCIYCAAAGISILLVFLLCCRYGEFLPWQYLRFVLPGADTIRVTGRCMGVLAYPAAVMICLVLPEFIKRVTEQEKRATGIMIAVATLLVWEGQSQVFCNKEIGTIRAELANVSAPPQDCSVMFMCPQKLEGNQSFRINMMGWLIADRYSIKTINGYSGSFPDGWYLITDDIGRYYGALADWLNENAIAGDGIYGYIYESDTWIPLQQIFFTEE